MMQNTKLFSLLLSLSLVLSLVSCSSPPEDSTTTTDEGSTTTTTIPAPVSVDIDYGNLSNWVYWRDQKTPNTQVDCFFIAPTVYAAGEGEPYNLSMDNLSAKADFLGASNMERGIYDPLCRMYAPYYPQVALDVYALEEEAREAYLDIAYKGVRSAFLEYIQKENNGRPIILAGFSQGADMCIRLLEEFNGLADGKLLACYAIGWHVTQDTLNKNPHLQMAQSANDLGVIISFNTEAEGIETSLSVPESTLAINPLSWSTSSDHAPAELNLGACFTGYDGTIAVEVPALTGAYLDPVRGTLIVDDNITPQEYPPVLPIFEDGIYHIYDYLFFYRNLQENVATRINQYISHYNLGSPLISGGVSVHFSGAYTGRTLYELQNSSGNVVSSFQPGESARVVIYEPYVEGIAKFGGLAELTAEDIILTPDLPFTFEGNASVGYAIDFIYPEETVKISVIFNQQEELTA